MVNIKQCCVISCGISQISGMTWKKHTTAVLLRYYSHIETHMLLVETGMLGVIIAYYHFAKSPVN